MVFQRKKQFWVSEARRLNANRPREKPRGKPCFCARGTQKKVRFTTEHHLSGPPQVSDTPWGKLRSGIQGPLLVSDSPSGRANIRYPFCGRAVKQKTLQRHCTRSFKQGKLQRSCNLSFRQGIWQWRLHFEDTRVSRVFAF